MWILDPCWISAKKQVGQEQQKGSLIHHQRLDQGDPQISEAKGQGVTRRQCSNLEDDPSIVHSVQASPEYLSSLASASWGDRSVIQVSPGPAGKWGSRKRPSEGDRAELVMLPPSTRFLSLNSLIDSRNAPSQPSALLSLVKSHKMPCLFSFAPAASLWPPHKYRLFA